MTLDGERGVGLVTDHPFVNHEEWWERCSTCGLSMAAHALLHAGVGYRMREELDGLSFRCPECVRLEREDCTHACPTCGGTRVQGGPDEFGNYDPCPTCQL